MSVRESVSAIFSSSKSKEKREEVWRTYKRNEKRIEKGETIDLIPYTDTRLNHTPRSAQSWILDINEQVREHGEETSNGSYSLENCEEETLEEIKDNLNHFTKYELSETTEIANKGFLLIYTTLLVLILSGELTSIIELVQQSGGF